ncbi:MAG: hypothetical protein ACT4PU_11415 [Planctomycetota bacterium]
MKPVLRSAVSVGLLLWLTVSLAGVSVAVGRHFAAPTWTARLGSYRATTEDRYRATLGEAGWTALQVVWEHAPDARELVVLRPPAGPGQPKGDLFIAQLTTLLYPVLVTRLESVPADARLLAELLPATTYVLNTRSDQPVPSLPSLRVVVRGPGYELFRYDRNY